MSDELSAVGTLGGITEKPSGWFEIEVVMPGKQYPLRLATKKQELVELARAAGEQVMHWRYREQESDRINEHTGKPYVNRYFEGIEPASETTTTAAPSTMTKQEWAAKDSAIHKTACIKAAADALKLTLPAEPTTEDLNRFNAQVLHLAGIWHRVVLATRDAASDENIPF